MLGDTFRLTYIYNRGAAFGLHLGDYSRVIFLALTVVAVVVLFAWYRATPAHDRLRLVAIASVTGGAIGNLVDRVRSHRGVVDFLDFGLGDRALAGLQRGRHRRDRGRACSSRSRSGRRRRRPDADGG